MEKLNKKRVKESKKLCSIIEELKSKKTFSWEYDGLDILASNKRFLLREDIHKLKFLLLSDISREIRSNVSIRRYLNLILVLDVSIRSKKRKRKQSFIL